MELTKLEQQLKEPLINVKTLINWDNPETVEQLTLLLRETQTELETKMTQSIESHILGKQKLINTLNETLPTLVDQPSEQLQSLEELDPLTEMLEIKTKIDYCLGHLQAVINPHEAPDPQGDQY